METPTPHTPKDAKRQVTLSAADLEECYKKLKEFSIPPDQDGCYSFILFFTTWERIVCFFSSRLALNLYAKRAIRDFHKKQRLSPWREIIQRSRGFKK